MTFRDFFFALNGKMPFHWQDRLAEEVAEGNWPDALALPTASGKTACVDIAVYAMAKQVGWSREKRTAPRRVFFVVDRRVIVDEVFQRMRSIESKLCNSEDKVLTEVKEALCFLTGHQDGTPIVAYQMRGGIYRDSAWIRNPAQPALIASTVDQTGSRLLFQGYGVSASTKPIHAALIANDALIVLDEAHCSVPFGQTLESVRKYRETGGVAASVRMPFHVVEMSATPVRKEGRKVFPLPDQDRAEEFLGKRLRAKKKTELIPVKKSGDSALEERLFETAVQFVKDDTRLKNIVIFVNRVARARAVFEKLFASGQQTALMIGRMRPIDRDELTERYQERLKSGAPSPGADEKPLFVVATQCLEVGADYDFDALVTECASIDALRQRFGRLNRLGREDIEARAAVLTPPGKLLDDPVYGDAIHHTWEWLQRLTALGGTAFLDFANEGPGTVGEAVATARDEELRPLRTETKNAPVMFREYLDIWSQTNPAPEPQPDPGYFLHGPDYESDDVHVIWRADLDGPGDWIDIVSLCPPSSAEAMPVSLRAFRKWFREGKADETEADIAQTQLPDKRRDQDLAGRRFLVWRGDRKSKVWTRVGNVRPGDTIVVPVSYGGWNTFGFKPDDARADRAEEALLKAKQKAVLRTHPELNKDWPDAHGKKLLLTMLESGEKNDISEALKQYQSEIGLDRWPGNVIELLVKNREIAEYPDRSGYVLRSRGRVQLEEDDGEDDLSSLDQAVSLRDHTEHVREWAAHFLDALGLSEVKFDFDSAALRLCFWGGQG
jgi:CRISPR-associated endonuclease/helicase Cas3